MCYGSKQMTTQALGENLPRLVEIMQRLLAPDGCAWDREQTLQSLRAYVLEEAFEVADAIDRHDATLLCEELGDLLLQVVFQSELARAQGWFALNEVIEGISNKLIRRHPHVFGDVKASNSQEALKSWENIKAQENVKKGRGRLDGVPTNMPALLRAVRLAEKAAHAGYDWPGVGEVRHKVDEELAELDQALLQNDKQAIEAELGDVLFALASLAYKAGVDPESALRETLGRFTKRFEKVEGLAQQQQLDLASATDEQRDLWWQQAKRDSA